MTSKKYRPPIYQTAEGKELDAKQRAHRLKILCNMAKTIAGSYPGWLNVRIWKPEKIENYARAYVGSAGGYLVITPRGISEFDRQSRRGKLAEVRTLDVLPWQRSAYEAYKKELFETAKDFVELTMESEQSQWDKLADKLGYSQSESTSFDVLDLFDIEQAEALQSNSSQSAMDEARRGDVVAVGKTKWVVFADRAQSGGMLSLYKFGSKGTKAYRAYADGDGVSVRQINGVADFVGPVVATGTLELTGEKQRLD